MLILILQVLGRVAQSVTCLTADMCLTADLGVSSLIPALSHTFMEIISGPFSSLPLIQEGMLSVKSESMCTKYKLVNCLVKLAQEKSVVR